MKDFTLNIYREFLDTLISRRFRFQPYAEFIQSPFPQVVILRHDVDARKENSLEFAKIQHEKSIRGTYYFRMVPQSFDKGVIREIASMGHEIGYHYETMDVTGGDIDKAYNEFCKNLEILRELAPIQTICMHGSPRSPHDNRLLWEKYGYRDLGIIGEPYLDTDFEEVGYLTDTGRRWNGSSVSIRDKVSGKHIFNFRNTQEIIEQVDKLPARMMFTFHPQRWSDHPVAWTRELIMQNVKNQVKRFLIKK
ncbi:MAG: hypothetical protein HXX13_16775 [Bacteroidetes bacterium]|nr:hypothetical protein [Bacteroidota bacterium]